MFGKAYSKKVVLAAAIFTFSIVHLLTNTFSNASALSTEEFVSFKTEPLIVSPAAKNLSSSCHRYARVLISSGGGFGHRFGEVIMGMMLAQMTNSIYVFDSEIWQTEGGHGNYEWLLDFLPFHDTAATLLDIEESKINLRTVKDQFPNILTRSKGEFNSSCNLMFVSSWSSCNRSCFEQSYTGTYNQAKWRLREVFSRTKFEPSVRLFQDYTKHGMLSIAWHMRGGDIVLHSSEEFYKNVATELMSVLQGYSYHFFFFGEDVLQMFPFMADFCHHFLSSRCNFPNVSNGDTFYHFVVADILVTSGSSFPIAASVFRSSLQPTFSVMPKENSRNFYMMSEDIPISAIGHFEESVSRDEIRAQINLFFQSKSPFP